MGDKERKRSLLYGCYLLQSVRNHRRTYIGFTMDPRRRLRQHNGEIKGGARKTDRWKPWNMVLCVWGFPGKVLALQFEYAWQHPSLSRHVKDKVAHLGFCKIVGHGKQSPVQGVDKNVRVLLEMLQAIPYNRIPLRVHFLEESLWTGLENMFGAALPNHLTLTHGSFDDLQELCKQRLTMVMPPAGSECAKCSELLKPGDLIVHCPHCECLMHLSCAATVFTGTSTKLMPDDPADCLKCSVSMDWLVLLRNQRVLRSAGADECEEGDEEEEDDDGNHDEDHGDDDCDGDDDGGDDDEEEEGGPKVSIGAAEAEVRKVLFCSGDSDMQAFEPSSSQIDCADSSLPSLSWSPPSKSHKQNALERPGRAKRRAALQRCDSNGGDHEPSEVGSCNDQKARRTPVKKARTQTTRGTAACADAAASSSVTASAPNSPKVDRCNAHAVSKPAGASASLRQRLAQRTGDGSAFSI